MTSTELRSTTGGMILYSASLSMFGAKVQIALIEKAIDYRLVMVPYDRERGYEPRHPEVIRVNPKRQVPILIDGDVELFDSTQIFEYLDDTHPAPPLWPREPAARAVARQLEMKSDEVYFPHVVRLMGLQDRPDDPAAVAARDAASRYYSEMEARLTNREWLAGDYSFADIAFYMAALFGERMGAVLGPETPKLLAWRERMTSRPSVMPVVATMAGYLSSQSRPVPGWLAAAVG